MLDVKVESLPKMPNQIIHQLDEQLRQKSPESQHVLWRASWLPGQGMIDGEA